MVASIGHYIDNKPVAGKSGRTGDITNPATGEVTAKVAFASVEEVDQAVQIAKKAQAAWAATPPLRRQRVMFNLKGLIEKHTDDLAMRMLADLPRQRPSISLRHPVLGLDEVVRRNPRFKRLEELGVLKILDLGRLLKLGRVHGRRCSLCAVAVQMAAGQPFSKAAARAACS